MKIVLCHVYFVVNATREHEQILASERTGVQQLHHRGKMAYTVPIQLENSVVLSSARLVSTIVPNVFPWASKGVYSDPVVGGSKKVKPFTFATLKEMDTWLNTITGITSTNSGSSYTYTFTVASKFSGEFWTKYGLGGDHAVNSTVTVNPLYKEYDRSISMEIAECDNTGNKSSSLADIHFDAKEPYASKSVGISTQAVKFHDYNTLSQLTIRWYDHDYQRYAIPSQELYFTVIFEIMYGRR